MRNALRSLLAFALVVASLPSPAAAADQVSIAVLDFDTQGAPAGDAAILSEYVRQALVARGEFTVVDRKNMSKAFQEQALQQTGCTSSECAVKLGKVLNVQKMIVGTYGIMEGGFRVMTAQMVDVATHQIERSAKIKGFEVSNADEAAESLVRDLITGSTSSGSFSSSGSSESSSSPGDMTSGMLEGQMDGKANGGGAGWFFAGCCLNLIGVAIAYSVDPSPPPGRVMGKSSDYAVAYTSAYGDAAKKAQGKSALIGCVVGSLVFVIAYVVYIVLVVAAFSSAVESATTTTTY
ncbi:MAG: hypothetical protein AAB368_00390 [bacterium]